ncbi:MAG: UDP-3-O-(3-hydroxymyristoyl)glucosamine N-acyltransferase [Mariprofundus sp.]|nr:UDP-3-O-(3-hydroxymyristoyl)glucosamine N-acyltransferase [Mariprofundus sp.]
MSAISITLAEVATLVGGKLEGEKVDPTLVVTGIQTLKEAGQGELSFLANNRYKLDLTSTTAAAVFLAENIPNVSGQTAIRVKDPYLAFAQLQRFFHPDIKPSGRRHATAVVAAHATIAADVDIAAHAVIGEYTTIGSGSRIGPGCVIGDGVVIGRDAVLHANTVVNDGCQLGNHVILQPGAVIGSDGFGYAWSGSQYVKIPQVGRVIIEDDVEIGANSCIDRGAIGDTVIEHGVKLDNLIQIAHNVRIGAFTAMAGQSGVAGSTEIGKGCQMGGQVAIAGHLKVGDGCRLAGKTGVLSDLKAGGVYAGSPAMPHRTWLKISALLLKLPELLKVHRNK